MKMRRRAPWMKHKGNGRIAERFGDHWWGGSKDRWCARHGHGSHSFSGKLGDLTFDEAVAWVLHGRYPQRPERGKDAG